jgi:hypothetical protein
MPRYEVIIGGKSYEVNSPEELSDEQAHQYAQQEAQKDQGPRPGENPGSYVLRRGGDMVSGAIDTVTGRDRMTPDMQNMREIGAMPGLGANRFKQAVATATAHTDQERQTAMRSIYPDAKFRTDAKGNPIIQPNTPETGSTEYAINKPGFSAQDWYGPLVQGLAFAGAGKVAAGAEGTPTLSQALRVGSSSGAASVGMDLAHNAAGGKKDLITMGTNAALSAGLGGAFEAAAPKVSQLVNTVRQRLGGNVFDVEGRLTPEANKLLQQYGVNPENLTPEFIDLFRKGATNTNDPLHAFRAAEAQTLPVPIRQTRGQITGDPVQQRTEEALRRGSYGDDARLRMSGIQADQQAQIQGNIPQIQARLSGGQPSVYERGQGGEMVSNRLNTMRDAEKAGVDAAYDAARSTNAFLPGSAVDTGSQRITASVLDSHALESVPKTASLLKQFEALAPNDIDPVRVNDLYRWRQRVSSVRSNGGEEAVAAGKAIKAFDATIDEALDKALMSGDDDAIQAWRNAISTNKQFAERFKGNDLVGKLTQRVYDTDSRELAVDPSSAANYILGRAKMGPAGKQNIVPDMKKLRNTLGADSQEWNALREEVFLRFVDNGRGAMSGGEQMFSGAGFKKAWTTAWNSDAPLMSQLFTQQEKGLIDQFANVSARVTNPVAGGSNPSGTSYAIFDMLKRIPFIGQRTSRYLLEGQGASQAARANSAPTREIPAGYLGAAGAWAANQ